MSKEQNAIPEEEMTRCQNELSLADKKLELVNLFSMNEFDEKLDIFEMTYDEYINFVDKAHTFIFDMLEGEYSDIYEYAKEQLSTN